MLTEKTFRPGGKKDFQVAISYAKVGDKLEVLHDPDKEACYLICDGDGEPVGALSSRHWVSLDLEMGREILHASVNSRGEDDEGYDTLTVRIVTGEPGEKLPEPVVQQAKVYRANIVGESYRQSAISQTKVGDAVTLSHDVANRYDPRAIAVMNAAGQQIGFLPRGGWLTDALLDEGKSYVARIGQIHRPEIGRPHAAVVLDVVLE